MGAKEQSIIRIAKYKNALTRFKALGFNKVFSDNLADALGVSPAQVRKDFSLFGIEGKKRGGFNVSDLIVQLQNLLGQTTIHDVVVVGAGNIGNALMKYTGFDKAGVKITAIFDVDPQKVNRTAAIPILPIEEMKDFIRKKKIKLGIIAVPESFAQMILDEMVSANIKGILNFAPLGLKVPEDVFINNIDLLAEIEKVIYFVNVNKENKN